MTTSLLHRAPRAEEAPGGRPFGRRILARGLLLSGIVAIALSPATSHSHTGEPEPPAVGVPLLFSLEGEQIRTGACLRIRERVYQEHRSSWSRFRETAGSGPEGTLARTIQALKSKDRPLLEELSHPELGRDPARLGEQAIAYFSQFEQIDLKRVHSQYLAGDLRVFFVEVCFEGTCQFADFPFSCDDGGGCGFLPYKTESFALRLLRTWFQSPWGPGQGEATYCDTSMLEGMTHRVSLDGGGEEHPAPPEILLRGTSFPLDRAGPGRYAALHRRISDLTGALAAGRYDIFFAGLTSRGRAKIEAWFAGATQEERRTYVESLLDLEPLFVFDADPLFIVYTRTASSGIQVMYFVRDDETGFRWANASYASMIDGIFKSRRFIQAAGEKDPFGQWGIPGMEPSNEAGGPRSADRGSGS